MLTIQVKHLVRGQPRPYADHTYRSEITFEALRSYALPRKEEIRELVRVLVHNFRDGNPDRLTNPLKTWSAGRREIWLAEIREPFCD